MESNELLLALTGIASLALVLLAWRLDKERLYSAIVIFLILIAIAGGKIVEFFGHETNTGNIFYACVFLATYFLIERYGRREGIRSIWIGVAGVVAFFVLLQLTLLYTSSSSTQTFSDALTSAFSPASRLALASLLGYIASQTLNVHLYCYLKERMGRNRVWLRANASNICAQALDSVIFFTIAFWGVVPPGNIQDIMVTGFIIKVVFIMLTAPLLHLNRIEEEDAGYTSFRLP